MKNAFFSALLAFSALQASAQAPYTVSTRTEPYAALTTAPVNGTTAWSSGTFSAPLPFTFKLFGTTPGGVAVNRFNMPAANFGAMTDTTGTVSGFVLLNAALVDRGLMDNLPSRSPIRFQTTGTAPSRIFKAEVRGAGFVDEIFATNSQDDSVNIQLWLFEGSNAVEIHYGTSRITAANNYFGTSGPSAGFVKNLDYDNLGGFEKYYGLTGSATAPVLDSFTTTSTERGMTAYPAAGTVYRFVPRGTATQIEDASHDLRLSAMYPNPFTDQLSFQYSGTGTVAYQIVAMNGSTLLSGTTGYGTHHLDVSRLIPGAYIVRLASDDEARSAQFIKR